MSLRLLLPLAILTLCAVAATAQSPREITKQEFRALEKDAYAKLQGATYRERMTLSPSPELANTEGGTLVSQTSEHTSTDRRRVVNVWRTRNGTRKEETVQVEGRKFVRKNDGPWEDIKREPKSYSMYGDPNVRQKEIATYRHLGVETVRGTDAELIEEMIYREDLVNGRTLAYGYVNRLWIAKDGRVVRSEWKNSGADGLVTSFRVTEYEYDPSIKIESPMK